MYLSRIRISNFRNFSDLDVNLGGNIVVVGENRVGKSNLLYALRLIFDPTLPDSARELTRSDFWDGLTSPSKENSILVSVEIKDFEADPDVLAILTEYRLDKDEKTVRLTYEYRPKPHVKEPTKDDDYEFVCYGGESEAKHFGYDLRSRITMELLPALRDAEGELANWRRSPLRPLIEQAFSEIDAKKLEAVKEAVENATEKIAGFKQIQTLENNIGKLFAEMSGARQDVKPKLGFAPTDISRLSRGIRLLIDEGVRGISEASLGSANLIFLTLKTLHVNRLIEDDTRDHTILAIEEPEAHLHPHLQRSVYRHLFESVNNDQPMSAVLTTHSPHIASVAPLHSLMLLKETEDDGTKGYSVASLSLDEGETADLTRYLDVTRAEMLFARGVILVEGDAERFLIPEFAKTAKIALDHLGITVCSVAGTNFKPYAKFLTALHIPFAIVTDWDPMDEGDPLGWSRTRDLAEIIQTVATGKKPTALLKELDAMEDPNDFASRCEDFGIFSGINTLEIDLFSGKFIKPIAETLREGPFGKTRLALIDEWEADPKKVDHEKYIVMIETIGKGRFAQRLATRVSKIDPPAYIANAIKFVAERV
jgi:putative ATP-dependent endonuclease of the OLD family